MSLNDLVLTVNYSVLAYFLVINGVYIILYAISFAEITDYIRREVFSGLPELFTSNYAPPVSVIVPAYNEEATIADSVRSFLALHYPLHEVVVVNDGSKDQTMEVLMQEFDLYESDQPVRLELETAPLRGVYTSPTERLVVVDKENGGKSDALNTGACAARYPLICCMDADIILEEDALLRVARPMIESSEVAAVGGIVRVANGSEFEKGRIVNVKTPRKLLPNFQIVEYLRAFTAVRTAWSKLNCLLIISGAFGMFRRRDLISAGGYAHDTVGEDMELTTRIHRALRENHRRYRVTFVPDPVAWTEVPDTLRVLGRQRDRWHRGLIDSLFRHRKMLFNPRYGTVGLIGMPYFFLFEFIGPVVEILGYVAFATGLLLGLLNLEFAIAFFLAAVGLGALLSTAAVFLEELRLERYPRSRDLIKLTAYSVVENFGYRQMNTLWRAMAIVSFLRRNQSWGAMERKGFAGKKTSIPEARRQITEPERGDDTTVRRYLRPRRQAPEAGVEEQPATAAPTQDSPQETPASTETEQPEESVEEGVQLGGDAQLEEDERLEGAVTVTSEYIARLERESEDANALIRDLGEFVERVDVLRDRLKEDARRIGELRERLEQGIAEVNALRSQIEEDTSRVDELIR